MAKKAKEGEVILYKVEFKYKDKKYFDIISAYNKDEATRSFFEYRDKKACEISKISELKV